MFGDTDRFALRGGVSSYGPMVGALRPTLKVDEQADPKLMGWDLNCTL